MARADELILQSRGYRVIVAPMAQYALDLMDGQQFDLILLDVMLMEMDGDELLRKRQSEAEAGALWHHSGLCGSRDHDVCFAK